MAGAAFAWTYITAEETGSMVFIDDVTVDRSRRRNVEVYKAVLSAQTQPNAARLTRGGYSLSKARSMSQSILAKATQEILKGKSCILQWPS